MHRIMVGIAITLLLDADASRGPAREPHAIARLDHIIVVVDDLDSAAAPLARIGFRLKAGRLHPNNLINRHIKFRDGTAIELMSLAGPPKDSMALRYQALLERGAGGAYVALRTDDLEGVARIAQRLGLPTRVTSSGPWRFLGFPRPSDASAVFFVSGGIPADDGDAVLSHANGAIALAEVQVEGGALLDSLLAAVGVTRAASGRIVVVPPASGDRWPRPVRMVVMTSNGKPIELDVRVRD